MQLLRRICETAEGVRRAATTKVAKQKSRPNESNLLTVGEKLEVWILKPFKKMIKEGF